MYVVCPPLLYLAFAMTTGLNIGIRHILPVFPFIVILAAVSAHELATRHQYGIHIVVLLLIFHAASSLRAFPNYLTYSNELFGGPSNTRRLLDDSNVDWGQQLKQVAQYVKSHQISECWFAYMVPQIDLKDYGVPCRSLPRGPLRPSPLVPESIGGAVFISAFHLSGKSWGPDELSPYRMFVQSSPDDVIANSILVFRGSFRVPLAAAVSHANYAQQLLPKDPPGAIEEFRSAVALAPNSADMNARLCQALKQTKRVAEAEPFCMKALSIARSVHPEYQFERVASVRVLGPKR